MSAKSGIAALRLTGARSVGRRLRWTCADTFPTTTWNLRSECGAPLVHHNRVFARGTSHISLRENYLANLRTFIMQSEAVGQWRHDKDPEQLSPVHKGSDSPRSIRQQDSDEESSRCKTRWVRSPRKLDVPAASSRDLRSLLYDGRPAILPVSIRMSDLVGDNVIVSVGLPSVIAPPGDTTSSSRKVRSEDGVLCAGPASMGDSEPAIMSEFSSDTDPNMEDELC